MTVDRLRYARHLMADQSRSIADICRDDDMPSKPAVPLPACRRHPQGSQQPAAGSARRLGGGRWMIVGSSGPRPAHWQLWDGELPPGAAAREATWRHCPPFPRPNRPVLDDVAELAPRRGAPRAHRKTVQCLPRRSKSRTLQQGAPVLPLEALTVPVTCAGQPH